MSKNEKVLEIVKNLVSVNKGKLLAVFFLIFKKFELVVVFWSS